jgi:REP element-mobilizing transposase RayT
MARAQRIEYEGAVYHVTARGNERREVFRDDADREYFLRVLGESVGRFEVRLYLFCLMANHIHLVVETPRARKALKGAGHKRPTCGWNSWNPARAAGSGPGHRWSESRVVSPRTPVTVSRRHPVPNLRQEV